MLKKFEIFKKFKIKKLYSDSQAVIKSLQKRTTKNEIIQYCHIKFNELVLNNKVTINWIPGHERYEENERADHLANLTRYHFKPY